MIDTRLVDRYVARGDPSAFGSLVARHGPAVFRTCRDLLHHDPHAAEDAFQATFLILVRRAPSIRDPERLGRWLVGVARRVASRSRRRSATQAERERRWAETRHEAAEPERPLFEIRRVVREELDRLPEEYRLPLSLCYLEGLTHEQAAQQLGWPVGTVKVRLVRARARLRDRLDRRGVGFGVAFLLLLLRKDAGASMTAGQASGAVQVMSLAASGKASTLQAMFPRVESLARHSTAFGSLIPRWQVRMLFVVFLALSAGGFAFARQATTARQAAFAASIRLAMALEAGCR